MKKLLTLIALITIINLSFAQDTIYIDINKKKSDKENAVYYNLSRFDSANNVFILENFYITGERIDSTSYKSLNPLIKHGKKKTWEKSGEVKSIKLYVDNVEVEYIPGEEKKPEFPGGYNKLLEFIFMNITYPVLAQEKNIQGTVFVKFKVKKDGSIGNVEIFKGVHKLLDDEAIRVIKMLPNFLPATKEGEPVEVEFTCPISFNLGGISDYYTEPVPIETVVTYSIYKQLIEIFQDNLNKEFADSTQSPLTKEDLAVFKSLEFYPISQKYQITAKFVRTENQTPFGMPTTTDRKPVYEKYGEAHFKLSGKEIVLNIYQSHDLRKKEEYKNHLFLPFNDLTAGDGSYSGGRYLDLEIPKNDKIVIDFNKAYNPYCAYNHKYSCPLIPAENIIPLKIKAGVKDFEFEK